MIFKFIDPLTIHADFWIFPHLYPLLNYIRLGVDRLWVYKFENRFVGSLYHPSSACKRTKQNSNFFYFLEQASLHRHLGVNWAIKCVKAGDVTVVDGFMKSL